MYCCALLLRYKENCPSSSESSDQNFLDGETQGSKEQGRGSSKNQQKHADTTKVKHDSSTVFTLHMFFFLKKRPCIYSLYVNMFKAACVFIRSAHMIHEITGLR
jgi:hypothetical protein